MMNGLRAARAEHVGLSDQRASGGPSPDNNHEVSPFDALAHADAVRRARIEFENRERLAGAAPDLLRAARHALGVLDGYAFDGNLESLACAMLRAAINKATAP